MLTVPETFTDMVQLRLLRVRVTFAVVPREPCPAQGRMPVRMACQLVPENFTPLVVPFGVTTLAFLVEGDALAAMFNVATTVVLLTTPIPLTVTPLPVMLIAEAPVRPVGVRVTCTEVPAEPEAGLIAVRGRGGSCGTLTLDRAVINGRTAIGIGPRIPKEVGGR